MDEIQRNREATQDVLKKGGLRSRIIAGEFDSTKRHFGSAQRSDDQRLIESGETVGSIPDGISGDEYCADWTLARVWWARLDALEADQKRKSVGRASLCRWSPEIKSAAQVLARRLQRVGGKPAQNVSLHDWLSAAWPVDHGSVIDDGDRRERTIDAAYGTLLHVGPRP